MNIESLGRQAIDRIKSEWGLPLHGFVAGGAIANIVWELVSGNKAVVNDIDIFVFDGIEKLNLTVRSERCLKADEVYTLTQLLNCTKDRLLKTPNMGRKSVNEIIEKLAEHGLKLKGEA